MTDSLHIRVVHVIVPVHNEEAHLPRHLLSLWAAATALVRGRPGIKVRVTLVLDSCTDSSEKLVRAYDWVDVLSAESRTVGEVRAVGVARVHDLSHPVDPRSVWVASTDADTVVPATWLLEQLRLAEAGHDLVLGTVSPDRSDLSSEQYAAWAARHVLQEGHIYVHGANMGFTLAAYLAVGGFSSVSKDEDVSLARRMQEAGVAWCATTRTQVVTSGRRIGRAPHGFASYLRGLPA